MVVLLNSLIFAAAIGGAAWAFSNFARGVNAATRHVILWTVLLAVLAIPAADTFMTPSEPAAAPPVHAIKIEEAPTIPATSPVPMDRQCARAARRVADSPSVRATRGLYSISVVGDVGDSLPCPTCSCRLQLHLPESSEARERSGEPRTTTELR